MPKRCIRLIRSAATAFAVVLAAGCSVLTPQPQPEPVVVAPQPEPEPVVIEAPAPVVVEAPPPAKVEPPVVAQPKVERVPHGAPNVPYVVNGVRYEPYNRDVPMVETGIASWYGKPFHGRRTASGERYDMHGMTAAHKTMPLPSWAVVRNLRTGAEVVVRVNDRGPFKTGRLIDLSFAAARKLGIDGLGKVEVVRLTHEVIASGAWRSTVVGSRTRSARAVVADGRAPGNRSR
jgi:rare lipoprotein A